MGCVAWFIYRSLRIGEVKNCSLREPLVSVPDPKGAGSAVLISVDKRRKDVSLQKRSRVGKRGRQIEKQRDKEETHDSLFLPFHFPSGPH